eukprot:gene7619-9881_t
MLKTAFMLVLVVALAVQYQAASASSPSIAVNTTLIASQDWVKVSFTGVPEDERKDCWIGVYSPPDANVTAINALSYPATAPWTATAAIKFQYCTADPNFASKGEGAYDFSLINMREDVVFWLFFGGINTPKAIAKTKPVSFTDTDDPRHITLALTGDPTEMRVTWNSASPDNAVLIYGFEGTTHNFTLKPNTTTYSAEDLCGEPAKTQGWREPGYIHTVIITGLKPGISKIWYQCQSKNRRSPVKNFVAAKGADPYASLRIVATADVGATEKDKCHYHWEEPDSNLTYQHMIEHGPSDLALHIGDISYATGYSAKWDLFMTQATLLASSVPLMTALGNHEQDVPGQVVYDSNDSGGECAIPTITRFPMPTPGDQREGWYSFEMGPVHFLVMDTELSCDPGSPQYSFFEKDLASVNRTSTPWVVFAGHRPMYYLDKNSNIDPHFQVFEPLLLKHEVDLVLVGHTHNIMRTCAVYNGTCQKPITQGGYDAPIHVCIGNGGMNLTPIPSTKATWTEYQAAIYGYSTIEVNTTHLHMQLFADETKELLHEFSIYRSYPRQSS